MLQRGGSSDHQNKTAPEPRVRQKRKKHILVILVYLCSRPAQGGGAGLVRYYHQNKTAPEPPLPILLHQQSMLIRDKVMFNYMIGCNTILCHSFTFDSFNTLRHCPNFNLLYWNGQLVWTPALGHYLCVARRGPGTVSSGIYRPPFCAVGTNVRRWLSYSHWKAYIHYAFIRQMASFLVSDSLTLGV